MVPFRLGVVLAVGSVATAWCCNARAQDASAWSYDDHSAVRLIAGSRSGAVVLGGIDFKLDPEWKTYWRTPGDSGVPPHFDFSKSENVEAVTVLWPAPKEFPDGAGGTSFGYKGQFILPLRVVAKAADKAVILRATINYAVCDKLCVPVEAATELGFKNVASTEDNELAAALDLVPKPAKVGDPNPLTIRDVRRDGKSNVVVDVLSETGDEVHLFVEGPTPDWALPVPTLIGTDPSGVKHFGFALDGLPPDAHADGAALKLTLVGHTHAYEFNVTLD